MILPIIVPDNFRIIAHRGASAYAPENTLAAFKLATKMGLREIELDTQLSSDGEVVLCHDVTLERYGHGNNMVEKMITNDLLLLDMGSWFSPYFFANEKMITLRTLFDHYGDSLTYHIELKGKSIKLPCVVNSIIKEYDIQTRCFITSRSYNSLAKMRTINSEFRLGWIVEKITDIVLGKAKDLGLFQLCPCAGTITRDVILKAHEVVEEVRSWGLVGGPAKVIKLIHNVIQLGCDGMTINWPDWVIHNKTFMKKPLIKI